MSMRGNLLSLLMASGLADTGMRYNEPEEFVFTRYKPLTSDYAPAAEHHPYRRSYGAKTDKEISARRKANNVARKQRNASHKANY